MHQTFRFKRFAAGALGALALSVTAPCHAATVQKSTETTQTERLSLATADPLAAMVGAWRGKWGGQAESSIEIGGTADEPAVRYCFRGDCWEVEDAALADGELSWTRKKRTFTWRLDGEVLRGQLRDRKSGRKWRVRMRRQ